jgi:tetratricopeptide (TPR) repeat protein
MNLADERLKGLDNASFTPDDCALLRCRVAADFISTGQYEAARESLGELWRGMGRRPAVEELGVRAAAEVLLRAGILSGWMGASQQAQGAQESAKDLISESISLFESLGEAALVAAARSELSLCYWREGAYDEARVLLRNALDELAETESRAKALLRLTAVENSAGRFTDSLAILEGNAFIFDERLSHALRGSFHTQLALVLKQLGTLESRFDYLDRAIIEFTAAVYHQEQAGNERYRAVDENNLANLLCKMGRYKEAHQHLDRAGSILLRLKDSGRLAQVDDTRARVLIAEKKYREAERVITSAVGTLEAGGSAALLAEALTTQGVAWARLGKNDESIKTLRRAVDVAEESGALSDAGIAALTLIEEHGARRALSPEELYELYRRADKFLRDAQHAESVTRLRSCARVVMRRMAGVQLGDKNFTIFNAVHEVEAKLIGQALEEAEGSVTRAAQLLGVRHQTFLAMLNNRHRKLLAKRNPQEKRLRSIIKKTEE